MRRSRTTLEGNLKKAKTDKQRAIAHYALGLFHDNNGREKEAIPHYEAVLEFDLEPETKAKCLAWLASSLWKTGDATSAKKRLEASGRLSRDPELLAFLKGLRQRINGKK